MADDRVEVDVWTSDDGRVLAIGRLLSSDRRVTPIAAEGQSISKAHVNLDSLDPTLRYRLNRDTGELEAAS